MGSETLRKRYEKCGLQPSPQGKGLDDSGIRGGSVVGHTIYRGVGEVGLQGGLVSGIVPDPVSNDYLVRKPL